MENSTLPNKTDVPVLDDKLYRVNGKLQGGQSKNIAWVELNAKIYILCLQHRPPDLELSLKENSIWDKIMAYQDGIGLLHVIWDITHKQDENMQSTMAYVEAFLEFSTTCQEPKQSNTHYYTIFRSIQDTVTAHGGNLGYHLKLYDGKWGNGSICRTFYKIGFLE